MLPALLVFTDLDGTLLDHDSYDWTPAQPALRRLRAAGVAVIFNSSKTAAEQIALRKRIGNDHPFIVENGAAVYSPLGDGFEVERFGVNRADLVALARALREENGLRYEGFSDWSPAQLAEITGLTPEMAALALERCCSEPVLWQDDDASLNWFVQKIEQAGFRAVRGGRFLHLMGRFDKSEAMAWLRARYERQAGRSLAVVALGDSPNDADMLDAADVAVVVCSAKSDLVRPTRPSRVLRTAARGPAGWQEAMDELLPELLAGS